MNREDIDRMIKESGMTIHLGQSREKVIDQMGRFATIVAAAEREACAKLCDAEWEMWANPDWQAACRDIADAIRARGK